MGFWDALNRVIFILQNKNLTKVFFLLILCFQLDIWVFGKLSMKLESIIEISKYQSIIRKIIKNHLDIWFLFIFVRLQQNDFKLQELVSSLSVFAEVSLQVWSEMKQRKPFQGWESLLRSTGEDFLGWQSLDFSTSPPVSQPPTFAPGPGFW